MSLVNKPAKVVTQEVTTNTTQVLVAKTEIGLGQITGPENFRWQDWPQSALSPSYIQRSARPNAIKDLAGSVARAPMLPGEPVTRCKLVKAGEGGVLAAILPAGMRAISTRIKEETGVGRLILPNDHVDVILTMRRRGRGSEDYVPDTLFRNVRVLAIGQLIEARGRQEARRRQHRHARADARAGRATRAGQLDGRDLARAAQHRRHQGRRRAGQALKSKIMRYGAKSRVYGVVN